MIGSANFAVKTFDGNNRRRGGGRSSTCTFFPASSVSLPRLLPSASDGCFIGEKRHEFERSRPLVTGSRMCL